MRWEVVAYTLGSLGEIKKFDSFPGSSKVASRRIPLVVLATMNSGATIKPR
jgi:hypothetical protein